MTAICHAYTHGGDYTQKNDGRGGIYLVMICGTLFIATLFVA